MASGSNRQHFQQFVDAGQPVGEVVAVNKFLITVRGLQPVNIHSLVTFNDGSRGFVNEILEDTVQVLHMGTSPLKAGDLVVVQHTELMAKVGKDFIGRVVSVSGEPLDGQGPIAPDNSWPVFNSAPPIYERKLLSEQMPTGITMIDSVFPIVRGQRMALLGDSKSGKSTMASQIAIAQRDTDQIVIYVLIAKRRSDIDTLINRLEENRALDKAIVLVSTMFDSLVMSYLAPYVGCAMAEYLWQAVGLDCAIVYDDLSAHAQAYREISLISGVNPGRDSYPGDIFHAHSALLERAGRLAKNGKSLTAIPLVTVDGGDITSYLPTNVMSITDGQWILDMNTFRDGLRPAISSGLSVTRVGNRGHNDRQKAQNGQVLQALAAYNQAQEYSHFGSDLALATQKDIVLGRKLYELLTQVPGETYSVTAQQMMLDVVFSAPDLQRLDIEDLKTAAGQTAQLIRNPADYDHMLEDLKKQIGIKEPAK